MKSSWQNNKDDVKIYIEFEFKIFYQNFFSIKKPRKKQNTKKEGDNKYASLKSQKVV